MNIDTKGAMIYAQKPGLMRIFSDWRAEVLNSVLSKIPSFSNHNYEGEYWCVNDVLDELRKIEEAKRIDGELGKFINPFSQ